jgi:RimJ/RimL family protein N-acetyltransferase
MGYLANMDTPIYLLRTPRLGLRRWSPADLEPCAQMNADPAVREFFPSGLMTRDQTAEMIRRLEEHFDQYGYGFYALDVLDTGEFIGFAGLSHPTGFEAWFVPCMEIGWRLRREAWGHGYATEAARACLQHGWKALGLEKIYAYTAELNVRSQRVMDKIGMVRAGEFDHPKIGDGHPLRRHLVYEVGVVTNSSI